MMLRTDSEENATAFSVIAITRERNLNSLQIHESKSKENMARSLYKLLFVVALQPLGSYSWNRQSETHTRQLYRIPRAATPWGIFIITVTTYNKHSLHLLYSPKQLILVPIDCKQRKIIQIMCLNTIIGCMKLHCSHAHTYQTRSVGVGCRELANGLIRRPSRMCIPEWEWSVPV